MPSARELRDGHERQRAARKSADTAASNCTQGEEDITGRSGRAWYRSAQDVVLVFSCCPKTPTDETNTRCGLVACAMARGLEISRVCIPAMLAVTVGATAWAPWWTRASSTAAPTPPCSQRYNLHQMSFFAQTRSYLPCMRRTGHRRCSVACSLGHSNRPGCGHARYTALLQLSDRWSGKTKL